MKHLLIPSFCFFLFPFLFFKVASVQLITTDPPETGLFDGEEVLEFTLKGNLQTLLDDRGDNSEYHPITLSYPNEKGEEVAIELKAKTRGNFRRDKSNCKYPPLWLNFAKKKTPKHSIFYQQDKIKLVTPCLSDKYIIREYLVYKLYNLITEKSFRARLVRVVFDDMEKGKTSESLYGILLEGEDEMAERNQLEIVKPNHLRPQKTDKDVFLTMAVFQFLIGNTDWSVQYRHNIKLIAGDSTLIPITVPYDFDHAGIVSAPYARPAEALQMKSTKERRYRGYCVSDMKDLEPIFDRFNKLKDQIYTLYANCPHIDEKYLKATNKFLDKFYTTINDPKACKLQFTYPCKETGTGNVVIQGLGFKEN